MKIKLFTIGLLCLVLAACSSGPEPINYGKEACAHCKMTIMDKRFANELLTARGKVYKFDAIECLTAFLKENPALAADADSRFLIQDYAHPGTFHDARQAWFLQQADLASPMGGNVAAFTQLGRAENAKHDPKAGILDWPTLLKQQH